MSLRTEYRERLNMARICAALGLMASMRHFLQQAREIRAQLS